MKNSILLFVTLFAFSLNAQESKKLAVQKTVETFFEGFHKQDTSLISKTLSKDVILQTIGKSKEGNNRISTENFEDLIQSITSIPDTISFQEKLLSFTIQIDGAMANAWTPYEFWYNNEFSHCGVNSFQLFKNDDSEWKIIYLIDTRRREGCSVE